ncbi:MAG: translation initiation factor IF-3 [Elusimicrobiota bacterium]
MAIIKNYSSPNKDYTRINNRIQASQVRVIDSDGTQLGVKALSEALGIARTRGMDLIEIAPQANPPVCKILDYSKYKYEQDKKLRESRKKQKTGLLKEVRFKPHIGAHDLDVKIRHIGEFIAAHDKVRITVIFRGREMQHRDLGMKLLMTIKERLEAVAAVEQAPVPDRNRLIMTLVPKPH